MLQWSTILENLSPTVHSAPGKVDVIIGLPRTASSGDVGSTIPDYSENEFSMVPLYGIAHAHPSVANIHGPVSIAAVDVLKPCLRNLGYCGTLYSVHV